MSTLILPVTTPNAVAKMMLCKDFFLNILTCERIEINSY